MDTLARNRMMTKRMKKRNLKRKATSKSCREHVPWLDKSVRRDRSDEHR